MRGIYSGAATCLQDILGVQFSTFHCMAHRLELAVNSVVKNITSVSHFRMLCDEFHNIYAYSTKRLVQLESAAKELSLQIFKIGRVFDVRWLMSSFSAVNAIWSSGVGRCQTMGGHTLKVNDRSRSDRAGPKAVLGVGAGGGRPLPPGGPGVLPPENFWDYTLL